MLVVGVLAQEIGVFWHWVQDCTVVFFIILSFALAVVAVECDEKIIEKEITDNNKVGEKQGFWISGIL